MKPTRAQLRKLCRVINPATYRMMTNAGFHIDDLNLPRQAQWITDKAMIRWMRGPICIGIWATETITYRKLVEQVMVNTQSHVEHRLALAASKVPSIKRRLKTDIP